jgi:hypothetical protein
MSHVVGTPAGMFMPLPKPVIVVRRLDIGVPAGGAKIVSFWFTRRNSNESNWYFFQSGPPFSVRAPGMISHATSARAMSMVLVVPCGRMRISLEVVFGIVAGCVPLLATDANSGGRWDSWDRTDERCSAGGRCGSRCRSRSRSTRRASSWSAPGCRASTSPADLAAHLDPPPMSCSTVAGLRDS